MFSNTNNDNASTAEEAVPSTELDNILNQLIGSSNIRAALRLADYTGDAIIIANSSLGISYANLAAKRIFRLGINRGLGLNLTRLMPNIGAINASLANSIKNFVLWHEHGSSLDAKSMALHGVASNINLKGNSGYVYLLRQQADNAIEPNNSNQSELAFLIYENTSEGMIVVDSKGYILDVNPAFTNLRGQHKNDVLGRHITCLNSPYHNARYYKDMWRTVFNTGRWQGEHRGQQANGDLYPEWLSINTTYSANGEVYRRVMIFSNISELKKAEQIIWQQANFDTLTNLPNRQLFNAKLQKLIYDSKGTDRRLALLFLDLDRFKEVNDTLGHAIGDNLLKKVARRLLACVRKTDVVARLGGDEFVILLDNINQLSDIERLLVNIKKEMMAPFHLGFESIYISASIGVSFFPDNAIEAESLLNNADQAMYSAKLEGRNRFKYFTESMHHKAQMRMRLVNDLHKAVQEQQFVLYYQPIVEISTGQIKKAEALIRWQHPELGLIPPLDFIPLAEETGLIRDIGEWVFNETARQIHYWRVTYANDMQISINISAAQLRRENIDYSDWRRYLSALGLSPKHLVIEITESLLIDLADLHIKEQLDTFRNSGMQVALDDFGTGYSSLSYLSKFNIDYLKIDKSFVANLISGEQDRVLCETIIMLARKLGLKVVAEGVETSDQYNLLKSYGCDFAQGYLFSKPLPSHMFEQLLISE